MATTFGSGERTLALTEQALGAALEVNWLIVRTFKGADLCSVGATGVAVGSDFPLLGGESHLFGSCDLAEVFVIGSNVTDKLFFAYGCGIATGGITVIQPTAANLQVEANQATAADLHMTATQAGWLYSGELAVNTNIVKASAGMLHGFLIETNGTNNVTVQHYDDPDSADTPVTPAVVVAGGDRYGGVMGIDVVCASGITEVHSGAGGIVSVYYR